MTKVKYADYQNTSRIYLCANLSDDQLTALRYIVGADLMVSDLGEDRLLLDFSRHGRAFKAAMVTLTLINGGTIN